MSGDSEVGEGKFEMTGGTLVSENGVFYTTNTDSEFTLKNVSIQTADDCEYLLRVTGNQNARGWGQTGSNGVNCTFTAIEQALNGKVVWDSISNLDMTLSGGQRSDRCNRGRRILRGRRRKRNLQYCDR